MRKKTGEISTKIETLIKILELCDTIRESFQIYQTKGQYKAIIFLPQALKVIEERLSTLTTDASFQENTKGVIRELSQALKQNDKKKLNQAEISWETFFIPAILQLLYRELVTMMNQQGQLTAPVAQNLLNTLLQQTAIPHTTMADLLLAAAYVSGFGAPELAYQATLQAFALQPAGPAFFDLGGRNCGLAPQREINECPICGKSKGIPYYTAASYLMCNNCLPYGPAVMWMQCDNCHNLFTRYYPEELYCPSVVQQVKFSPNTDADCVTEAQQNYLAHWSQILRRIQTYQPNIERVLEVGVGQGELIACALELGYQIECVEIERETAQKIADILDVAIWCCDFLHFATEASYSLITMGDVLEHVTDPRAALLKAYSLLEKDGVLWISTPNFESSFTRLHKFSDAMWKEAQHISWFSRQGLEELLQHCGFIVLDYCMSNHYNGSMELICKRSEDIVCAGT